MKKLLSAMLMALLLLCLAVTTACGGSSWEKPTLVSGGEVLTQGGFLVETEEYVYFINGVGSYKEDNSFGTPVKGALMVATKDSIVSGELNAQIVVPKLFVAEDVVSGLFIYDGYVYYGTPCTDKNSSGNIANSEMTFARTKLDGTDTKEFFTTDLLTYEYRIAEKDGEVYIVYYDEADLALYSYNTTTGEKITIAKTVSNEKGKYESLSSYMFTEDNGEIMVTFTNIVYAEDYIEEKASLPNYSRIAENYNTLYTYSAGDAKAEGKEFYGKVLLDGKQTNTKYELIMTKGEYVFFSETDLYSNVTNKGATFANVDSAVEVNNKDILTTAILIKSLEEVYYNDTEGGFVIKTTLVGSDKARENVCASEKVTSLLEIHDGNLYYGDSENGVSRIAIGESNAKPVKVSQGTIDNTWYAPQIHTFGGKTFMFYLDSTVAGSSYVHYVDLNSEVQEEVTEVNDKEVTTYYLDGAKLLGQMLDKDKVNAVTEAIDGIGTTLEFTEGDTIVCEKYEEALAKYNAIKDDKAVMEYLADEYVTKLQDAEKAIKLAKLYYALKDFTKETRDNFRDAYNEAKAYRAELLEAGKYHQSRDMLEEEYKYYYQQAEKVFDPVVE